MSLLCHFSLFSANETGLPIYAIPFGGVRPNWGAWKVKALSAVSFNESKVCVFYDYVE